MSLQAEEWSDINDSPMQSILRKFKKSVNMDR